MPEPVESLLATFLADRDHLCPQCEYNLRNLQGDRCPECGEQLVLSVNLAEQRQKLLITGLIGLSAATGLNGLLLVYGLIQSFRGQPVNDRAFWTVCWSGFVFEGCAMLVWLKMWRRIRKQSRTFRGILAAICWVLTLTDILLFSLALN